MLLFKSLRGGVDDDGDDDGDDGDDDGYCDIDDNEIDEGDKCEGDRRSNDMSWELGLDTLILDNDES